MISNKDPQRLSIKLMLIQYFQKQLKSTLSIFLKDYQCAVPVQQNELHRAFRDLLMTGSPIEHTYKPFSCKFTDIKTPHE